MMDSMRNTILGTVAGLLVGIVGTLGYSHFFGADSRLADAEAELAQAKDDAAKAQKQSRDAAKETDAMSDQIQQLVASKQELTKQLDAAKSNSPAAALGSQNSPVVGLMNAGLKQHYEEQLLLLTKRLNLTPTQVAALKAAMDEESKRTEAAASQMFSSGKVDAATLADFKGQKSVDQTLNDVLDPSQKTAYQQMKTEEKAARRRPRPISN